MGAFTLQGMAYFIYKMLAQEPMDQKAMMSNMQKTMSRQMQAQQMKFAQAQMEMEIKKQEAVFAKQMEELEKDPEVQEYLSLMNTPTEPTSPQHKAKSEKPLSLGAKEGRKRNADGTFAKEE